MNAMNIIIKMFSGMLFLLPIIGLAETCPPINSLEFKDHTVLWHTLGYHSVAPPLGWTVVGGPGNELQENPKHYALNKVDLTFKNNTINNDDLVKIEKISCFYALSDEYMNNSSWFSSFFILVKNTSVTSQKTINDLQHSSWSSITKEKDSSSFVTSCLPHFPDDCSW